MPLILRVGSLMLFLFGAAQAAAAPACSLVVRATPSQQVYDPFSAGNVIVDLPVLVRNSGSEGCEARFFLAPVNGLLSLANGGDRLLFRIDAPQGSVQRANAFGPFAVNVSPGGSQSFVMRIVIPAQQIVPRGDYLADFVLHGLDRDGVPLATPSPPFTVNVRVPGRVEMSITGSSNAAFGGPSGAGLNFGEAKTGKTERVFVHVWSNGSVNVSLASANGGKLLLAGSHGGDMRLSSIGYTARFDGEDAALRTSFITSRSPSTARAGSSYELSVTLGDANGKFAGVYKDVITINVDQN
ncbi:hypothetical protein F1C10_11060 [Sphingomonas sp. NBWT7]|uniref:hypothetical protein n=1 Tax=Sphingomonas sp. NBWT7 TaxID=2596913 RepID=UPI0016274726|nr:hypothetical protein [Sphingomonas sp. NBWT7]QNE32430.1 hypothetical protein F1C10_11060 [Sphingomonas sp. NBWT7]